MEERHEIRVSEENKPSLSFGFSKKISTRKLQSSTLNEEKNIAEEQHDFVTSVQGKELQSVNPKEEEKELVIPCIVKNSWRKPVEDKYRKITDKPKESSEGLDSQAVNEILEDTRRQQEVWEDVGKVDTDLAIPVVVQNKMPEGYETDEKLDVSLRPDEAETADYEQVPIEHYGLAMLRGMGWKPGEGVGKNKKAFKPVESVLRPKGLGLGADKSQVVQMNYKKGGPARDKKTEEELILKKGTCCMILKGAHHDLYGVVEGLDDDNARVMIKLTIGGKTVTQSQYSIKLVTTEEYDKYSKYLNKGKVDKYKDDEEKRSRKIKERERDRQKRDYRKKDRESDKRKDKDRHRDRSPLRSEEEEEDISYSKHKKKSHHEQKSSSTKGTFSSANSNGNHSTSLWVKPQIKVRVIDKHFKSGRYYNSKVVVIDVFDKKNCVVKTEDGKVLEGVSQSMLETVVPKVDPAYAMVVSGKHKGEVVQVMERNKKSCTATVQLLHDRNEATEIAYDSICEYVGNVDDLFDY